MVLSSPPARLSTQGPAPCSSLISMRIAAAARKFQVRSRTTSWSTGTVHSGLIVRNAGENCSPLRRST
jgi:hypothetical protein